jgi:hypothetical protein
VNFLDGALEFSIESGVVTDSLTKIADQIHLPPMLGYAQGMVCHARTTANVAKDQDVDVDTTFC